MASNIDYSVFKMDKAVKKVGVGDIPLAFTRLKFEAVPAAGGCCATSVFMKVGLYVHVSRAERECIGRHGVPVDSALVDEIVARCQPKGFKSWLASEWPVFRFVGVSGEPDTDGDHLVVAARLFSLEFNPSKYLTKGSGEIYRKWQKELYTHLEPWQADQWAYNALYRMQGIGSPKACGEIVNGLPDCMQETLAACSARFMAGKYDIKSLYSHICQ